MKLIIISNKLPICIEKDSNGNFIYTKSAGGVVRSVESLARHFDFIWIAAINDSDFNKEEQVQIKNDCWMKFKADAVFISNDLYEKYYLGFCEQTLGPSLLSYYNLINFVHSEYMAFKCFNKKMADAALCHAEDNDIVWIHDFTQIFISPIIKKANPKIKVLFYLHVPFPENYLLKPLKCRREVLESMISSDIIAFLTPEYAFNFKNALLEENLEASDKIRVVSIGVDTALFRSCLQNLTVQNLIGEIRSKFHDKKIILGVDRTDYIKGIPHKIEGFKRFLENNPEMIDKVVLLQIAVPCRACVKEHNVCLKESEKIIAQINNSENFKLPIHFYFNSVDFVKLVALYAASDIVLITSIIDGFNIVALEYLSCKYETDGIVLISKFAGVSDTLPGAVVFNPCNTEEIALAIENSMKMSKEEIKIRHQSNKKNTEKFNSLKWAEDLLNLFKE